MKKNNYENYPLGQEITGITFQQHQDQVVESINAVMLGLGLDPASVTILYGLEFAIKVGGGFTVTEGAVFHNGEIFLVDAYDSGTSGSTAVLTEDFQQVGDPVRLGDDTTAAVHFDRKYKVDQGTPGVGAFDLLNLPRITIATQYVDDQIDALVGEEAEFNTFPKVATALNNLDSNKVNGTTSHPQGEVLLDRLSPFDYVLLEHNEVHVFSSATIPAQELIVETGNKRIVKLFCDFYCSRNHSSDENINISLVYRIGSGSWTSLRGKMLRVESGILFSTLRAHLELDSTPTGDVEFGLRLIHPASRSINIAPLTEIEFDTIY